MNHKHKIYEGCFGSGFTYWIEVDDGEYEDNDDDSTADWTGDKYRTIKKKISIYGDAKYGKWNFFFMAND